MKPRINIFSTALVFMALGLAGCMLFSGSPDKAVIKAEAKVEAKTKPVVTAAQKEVVLTATAALALPESKQRTIIIESASRAGDLLAEANGPLSAEDAATMRAYYLGLVSAEKAKRETAEAGLSKERGVADALAGELRGAKEDVKTLTGKLVTAYASEKALADRWRLIRNVAIGIGGLFLFSQLIVPVLSAFFPGVGAIGILSKISGYVIAPALQWAKDRAVAGLHDVGKAVEDLRTDLPTLAPKITRTFDSYTDKDAQRVVGAGAKAYRETPPTPSAVAA